jgi:hypothetical protein
MSGPMLPLRENSDTGTQLCVPEAHPAGRKDRLVRELILLRGTCGG